MRDLSSFPDAHLRIFDRPAIPDEIQEVYLVGVCGTGMGSLAGLFQMAGYKVRGSDKAAYPPMSTRLAEMGVEVIEGYTPDNLDPRPDLMIIGNACTPTHVEAAFARENGLVQQSFPEALAHFFIRDRRSIVVAGTHGKTTTTGMMAHVFQHAGRDPGFLVGGVMGNGNISYATGTGDHFIVEGDEYDSAYFDKRPKFMHYRPSVAIVTSMEFDHADIYEDFDAYRSAFEELAGLIGPGRRMVLCGDDPEVRALAAKTEGQAVTYGMSDHNHVQAANLIGSPDGTTFHVLRDSEDLGEFFLPMSGRHNVSNALAVIETALGEGLSVEEIMDGLRTFKGLKRRQEIRAEIDGTTIVDDFAHHPTAVRETIGAMRSRFPGRRLVAVFEPRSNTSRRRILEDQYKTAFGEADLVLLSAPIFRHNDSEDTFLNADSLSEAIRSSGTDVRMFEDVEALIPALQEVVQSGDVVLIMSNGGFGNIHVRLIEHLENQVLQ